MPDNMIGGERKTNPDKLGSRINQSICVITDRQHLGLVQIAVHQQVPVGLDRRAGEIVGSSPSLAEFLAYFQQGFRL